MVDESKSTEQLIFDAALDVFRRKGLAGARMQEIADAAGINKSMLHYYFRSKELLFTQVFLLSFKQFTGRVAVVLNDETTTWEEKIPLIIECYALRDKGNADLPLFIITEFHNNPDQYAKMLQENRIKETHFFKQVAEAIANNEMRPVNPMQIWMSILSEMIFPVLARPMVTQLGNMDSSGWDNFIGDRKLIVLQMLLKYLKEF